MNTARHYDLLIDENNDPFRDPAQLQEYMEQWDGKAFLDALKLTGKENVLEIGIGTGRIAAKAAPQCMHLTGIDFSVKTIERAKENLKEFPNISLICDDFETHHFQETFDVVYSSLTMMHFENKEDIIAKAGALLNPGGIFCLSLDKNRSEYIDMGTRKIRIYPDDPENIKKLIMASTMKITNVIETEMAYILAGVKK